MGYQTVILTHQVFFLVITSDSFVLQVNFIEFSVRREELEVQNQQLLLLHNYQWILLPGNLKMIMPRLLVMNGVRDTTLSPYQVNSATWTTRLGIRNLTTDFTLKFKFCSNHKPLNHKSRLIRIHSSFESTKKSFSIKSEVLTRG